jgi:hypothetical protein
MIQLSHMDPMYTSNITVNNNSSSRNSNNNSDDVDDNENNLNELTFLPGWVVL